MPSPTSLIANLPEGLPELRVGRHRHPRDGACLMEYVSVLAGLPFTDRPVCTHPALSTLAQRVNDATSDANRPRLALLAPELIGVVDDPRRLSNVGATVVLGITTAGLRWAPQDRFMRRLQRRAGDHNEAGDRRWRYGLEMGFNVLVRHTKSLDTETRDRCLFALLERVTVECRVGAVNPGRPLIDRIDRRPRSLR